MFPECFLNGAKCSSGELPKGDDGSYGTSIPLSMALDPAADVMIAYEQNGEKLAPDHGYPVRIIIPGWIGGRMVRCSLNHAQRSLNHAQRSLNHAHRSLYHADCSLNLAHCSLHLVWQAQVWTLHLVFTSSIFTIDGSFRRPQYQ
jgi:hypothetical protein